MNVNKNLHWIIYSLFALSCAKQTMPTGGPKDTIPPILVRSIPKPDAINYKGNTLELTFSEMIITNNPKEQLIVTPAIGKDFEVKSRKNTVTISFENPLQDSTTYNFNFREAIQDITEKNAARNLQVAFSTGSYIDSLSIRGIVNDLIKGKPMKDVTVAIHAPIDTFNIFEDPATYFTKSDDKGSFTIGHLKADTFYIYAIDDKNRNLVADSRTEYYGFLSRPVKLTRDTADIFIGLIRLDARPLKLISARPYNTYFNIKTTKSLKRFELTTADSSRLFYAYGEDQSNIRIYNNLDGKDSLAVKLIAVDSIEQRIDTTLYAKFLTREVTPEKFDVSITTGRIIADKGLLTATITFTKPVKKVDFDSIYFQVDSLNKIHLSPEDFKWEAKHNRLKINKILNRNLFKPQQPEQEQVPATEDNDRPLRESGENKPVQKDNQLHLRTAAFISADNDTSRATTKTITVLQRDNLSRIIYSIGTEHDNILVQLTDNNLKVVRQIEDRPQGEFDDLEAGEYQIRVIIDKNDNNTWDLGNYLMDEEPEPVFYYTEDDGSRTINLKANWDYETAPMLITY